MPTSERFRDLRFVQIVSTARKLGGRVMNSRYTSLQSFLSLQCSRGHSFRLSAKNLLRGLWCRECRPIPRQERFLQAAADFARKKRGRCVSDLYKNARTPLRWRCARKHEWAASLDNVVNKNSWCPTCSALGASERKRLWWKRALARRKRR